MMKKTVLFLIIPMLLLLANIGVAQIDVSVSTDTTIYPYGEDFNIYVTASNPTGHSILLEFTTSCQAYYFIDYFMPPWECMQVLTSQTITAHSNYTWTLRYAFSMYPLGPGTHQIIGQVIGYGYSAPIYIHIESTTGVTERSRIPTGYMLQQNYPNPFNSSTLIQYTIPKRGHVTLTLYNTSGQKIESLVDDIQSAGDHVIHWNPGDLSNQVYIYRLRTKGFIASRKLILLK